MQQEQIKETVQAMTIQHTDLKPHIDQAQHLDWTIIFYIIGTFFVGITRYAYDHWKGATPGKRFRVRDMLINGGVSAISGVITYQLCLYMNVQANLTAAVVGLAGWMGVVMLDVLSASLVERLKTSAIFMLGGELKKEDKEDTK